MNPAPKRQRLNRSGAARPGRYCGPNHDSMNHGSCVSSWPTGSSATTTRCCSICHQSPCWRDHHDLRRPWGKTSVTDCELSARARHHDHQRSPGFSGLAGAQPRWRGVVDPFDCGDRRAGHGYRRDEKAAQDFDRHGLNLLGVLRYLSTGVQRIRSSVRLQRESPTLNCAIILPSSMAI
jgi:hypothetical protein